MKLKYYDDKKGTDVSVELAFENNKGVSLNYVFAPTIEEALTKMKADIMHQIEDLEAFKELYENFDAVEVVKLDSEEQFDENL